MPENYKYIQSDSVVVYPSARRINYPESRSTVEATFSNLYNNMCDGDGTYIITLPLLDSTTNKLKYDGTLQFELMIHGYYFKINLLNDITSLFETGNDIYVSIELDVDDSGSSELKGRDETFDGVSHYTGLKFSLQPLTSSLFGMKMLHRDGTSAWSTGVVLENYNKFDLTKQKFIVDGGIF